MADKLPTTESRSAIRNPLATPEAVALEPVAFPIPTTAQPDEQFYADWRRRLTRNLSRRSDGRWEPLSRIQRTDR